MTRSDLSRRHFLTATATATAAAAAVAAAAQPLAAQAGEPAAAPKASGPAELRWGVIGTGTRGAFTHVPVLKEAPASQIVALCDVSPERLQAAAAKVGHPVRAYADYQKLLADAEVNAVVIATPNLFHREMLLAALQAGKHVLCEKPAGVGPDDAAAMQHAAASSKSVVMFGMQYRNNPRPRQVRDLIASGRIGRPRYVVQNVSRGDWNMSPNVWQYADPKLAGGRPRNWRLSHAATGGTLNEFSCHYLDLLHWMIGGVPKRVSCDGGVSFYKDGRDTWDHATVTMKYADDVTAVHTLCLFGPSRNDLVVVGDEGSIEMKGEGLHLVSRRGRRNARSQEVPLDKPQRRTADGATLKLFEDFAECVRTGKTPEASTERAVAASKTCWLAELSSQRRSEVKWDDLA